MSIYEMFRRFLGFPNHGFTHDDEWPPENDDGPQYHDDDNFPALFNEPNEMFRHFEQHFEELFRSFGFMEFSVPSIPFGNERMPSSLPALEDVPLRDKLLKQPDSRNDATMEPHHPAAPGLPSFGRQFGGDPHNDSCKDQDLDSAISSHGLDAALGNLTIREPKKDNFTNFNFSRSSVFIRGADGKTEKRYTKKDSHGNEETSVVRQYGDRVHSFTTRRTNDGVQEHEENFVNMDEANKEEFEREWNSSRGKRPQNYTPNPFDSQDPSAPGIFHRLFKNNLPPPK